MSGARTDFQLRLATLSDADFLRALRNDEETRSMSRNTGMVGAEEHLAWLNRVLSNPGYSLWIVEVDGVRAGQVRIDPDQETSISIAPSFRGKGLSTAMIVAGIEADFLKKQRAPIYKAEIRSTNPASVRAFEKAGFHQIGSYRREGDTYLKFELSYGSKKT